MERYNLRATSLNDSQLTTELTKRGAQTFGTVKRKQQRLQRFLDAETNRAMAPIRITLKNNVRHVDMDGRTALRNYILSRPAQTGRTSIYQLINEYLG
jgi:hypothetical protein